VNVRVCRTCGAVLEDMGGTTGWVDVVSGDDGGTYDICPTNPELDGPHDPDPASERVL
jgi:hypothetical protein